MKKLKPHQIQLRVALLLLAATTVGSAQDGTTNQVTPTTSQTTELTSDRTTEREEKYRAQETSLDIFFSGSINQETVNHLNGIQYKEDVESGIGVGLNHFFTRHIGIGAEAYAEDTERHFVDKASASLIARLPLGESGFAPYLYVGGGRQFDPIELSFAQGGAGLEFRFTPNVGLFLDGRYVLTDGTDDHGLARVGLRLAF